MIRKPDETDRDFCDPTPEEIEERAAEVRRHWTERIAERRKVSLNPSWRPPLVMTIELVREINARNLDA